MRGISELREPQMVVKYRRTRVKGGRVLFSDALRVSIRFSRAETNVQLANSVTPLIHMLSSSPVLFRVLLDTTDHQHNGRGARSFKNPAGIGAQAATCRLT